MINRHEPVSQMGMKVQNVTWFVILNLFQDLKLLRVRRSRNEFGMTGGIIWNDSIEWDFRVNSQKIGRIRDIYYDRTIFKA